MKKSINCYILGVCLVALASCQKANDEIQPEETLLPMSIVARIGEAEPATSRYAGTPDNAQFTTGDQIGIFMDGSALTQWNHGSLRWEPTETVLWPDTNEHTFKAFYPYLEDTEYSYESIPMPSLLGQEGTFESIASKDFLIASTTQSYGTDGIVKFQGNGKTFQHVSSLVHLLLKDSLDLEGASIDRILITGSNIVASSIYSFETNKVQLKADADSDNLDVSLEHTMSGNADFYFVLNAKPSTSGNVSLTIEYTKDDKEYIAELSSFSGNTFKSGRQHNFTISIQNNQMFISEAEISGWTQEEMQDITINSQEKQDE